MNKIYVGDIGTVFDFNADPDATGIDLTGYTLSVLFQKPNGTSIERSAALKPASTTVVRYAVVSGDLDVSGAWKAQIKVVLGSNLWRGETVSFKVYDEFA